MACRLAGLSRSAYRRPLHRETAADPDRALRDWLRAYTKKHPKWGYRRHLTFDECLAVLADVPIPS